MATPGSLPNGIQHRRHFVPAGHASAAPGFHVDSRGRGERDQADGPHLPFSFGAGNRSVASAVLATSALAASNVLQPRRNFVPAGLTATPPRPLRLAWVGVERFQTTRASVLRRRALESQPLRAEPAAALAAPDGRKQWSDLVAARHASTPPGMARTRVGIERFQADCRACRLRRLRVELERYRRNVGTRLDRS